MVEVLLELQTVVVVVPTLCFLAPHLPVVVEAAEMEQEQVLMVVRVVVRVLTQLLLLVALETHHLQAHLREMMVEQVQPRLLPLALVAVAHLPLVVSIQRVMAVMAALELLHQSRVLALHGRAVAVAAQEQQERLLEMAD